VPDFFPRPTWTVPLEVLWPDPDKNLYWHRDFPKIVFRWHAGSRSEWKEALEPWTYRYPLPESLQNNYQSYFLPRHSLWHLPENLRNIQRFGRLVSGYRFEQNGSLPAGRDQNTN